MRKPAFCIHAKTKTQISFTVIAKLISAYVFATWIVQSLYFLITKFQASSILVWSYSLVCVGPGRKPPKTGFLATRLIIKSMVASTAVSVEPGPEVIEVFSCSTLLSMKFKLHINIEIARINGNFSFKSPRPVIYPAKARVFLFFVLQIFFATSQ